jgi:CRISPR-associated protein Cas1
VSVLYVTTPGAYVRKSGGRLTVSLKERELASVPLASIDSVVLFGPVQISTQAMHELLAAGISTTLLSRAGRFLGLLQSGLPKNVFVRLAQSEAAGHPLLALENARSIVRAKTDSQRRTLSLWRTRHWLDADARDYARDRPDIATAKTVVALQLAEAHLAKTYYGLLGAALPPTFEWRGRTRRPPRDPVNALLSLTYMCAVGEAVGACYATGLDPFVGFLHQLDYGRPSLALDLIEPLRPRWCDHFVMGLLQREAFSPDDFTHSPTVGCRLAPESLPRFFKAYGEWADQSDAGSSLRTALGKLARHTADAVRRREPADWTSVLEAV